jgi:hypothetical protein
MRSGLVALAVVLGLAPRAGRAEEPAEPEIQDASACPRLFGDARTEAANRQRRLHRLEGVRPVRESVELDFRGPWTRPRRFIFTGIELDRVDHDVTGEPFAVLRVTGLQRLGCADGLYTVGVDAAIGAGAHVLAILDRGLVLIESRDRLGYLLTPEATAPAWRLSWDADILFRNRSHSTIVPATPRRGYTPNRPSVHRR